MRKLVGTLMVPVLLFMIGISGCTQLSSPAKKPQTQQQNSGGSKPVLIQPQLAERVKEAAATVKGVQRSTAVVIDKDVSVAVKVTGFDRLRLESIRREVHRQVKKTTPGFEIHVSTDKKIFAELKKVESQIKRGQVQSPSQIQHKVEKLNKDMQG